MALPYSGQISMGQINVELGRIPTTANTSLDAAENGSYGAINQNSASRPSGSNPAAMSEWHGYNHSAVSALVEMYWQFNTGNCAGDSFQIVKNYSTSMVNTSANEGGTFTATTGDVIEVYVAGSFKGNLCDNVGYMITEDGNWYAGNNAPGYGQNLYDSFTVASGVGYYEIYGYIGMIAPV